MAPTSSHIESIVKLLPEKPGVYQYFDKTGKIIYVGKAKNLKKRVSSYFNNLESHSGKVRVLVSKIEDLRFIVVDTEFEALLLENNLIKEHQPRYNVLLKDDKTYPWICIKNEPFPRIFPTRNIIKDGSAYFGPYASVRMMRNLLDLVKHLYPMRSCSLNLCDSNIQSKKYKVCLEYHIGNCKGPCEGRQTPEDYAESVCSIREIMKGNIIVVKQQLVEQMKSFAETLEFERAQLIKEKIELLDNYQGKSTVVNPAIHNVDVFSIVTDENAGYVNYMKVISGSVVQSHTVELRKKLDETPEELLAIAIMDLRQRFSSESDEIIIPFDVDIDFPKVILTVPQRGDKKQLLDLSERNAKYYRLDKEKQKELVDPERHSRRILDQMMKDLRLKEPPVRIECFDNSNIQGEFPVAAMVCFVNAKPDKKEYRHFNIRTVEGPNDFASMEEVILRRYKRLLEEEKPLPQLIIVDGGKGQLSSALTSLEKLGLRGKINIIGIAKKLEEIYFPGDSFPLYLDKKSETLKIIQQCRDEAHRFGITHHRKKRGKAAIKSILTDIEGIGETLTNQLLIRFKSVNNIKSTSLAELQDAIGNVKGKTVFDFFNLPPKD